MNSTAWMMIAGATTAMACALPGTWLVLRRQSLLADALTHAILPGLAAGFLLTGQRSWQIMLGGALACGLITILLTDEIKRLGRMDTQAALGVIFSTLFALGLILVKFAAKADLDLDCVLAGKLEYLAIRNSTWIDIGTWSFPRPFILTSSSLLLSTILTILLYKEWRISSFDPSHAASMHMRPRLMHFLLALISTIACITSFQSVGVVLVLAMLIVPPVIALQFTDRLPIALLLAVAIAAICAPLGWFTSDAMKWTAEALFAPALEIPPGKVGTPPMAPGMAVASGTLLALCLLAKASYQRYRHEQLRLRIALEDALAQYWRHQHEQQPLQLPQTLRSKIAIRIAHRKKLLVAHQLTKQGQRIAQKLIASHRLWETYLVQQGGLPPGSEHTAAHRLEHVTDDRVLSALSDRTDDPTQDPHGKTIPPITDQA